MGIKELFNDLHGSIDPRTFVPLSESISAPAERFRELVEYLNVDPSFLYENPLGVVYRYYFWDGLYLAPLVSINVREISKLFGEIENQVQISQYGEMLMKASMKFQLIRANKEYITLFNMIDKKVLFHVFASLYDEIPDKQKWEAYRAMHVRAETGFDMLPNRIMQDLLKVQAYKSLQRKVRLQKLKSKIHNRATFTIYHGHNAEYDPKDDFCWTMQKETAQFFADRFGNKNGKVSRKVITFDDVLDFFDDRNEAEILLKVS